MSPIGFVTLLIIVYGASNRYGYSRALALGGATPAGASLVVGSTAVPTFYATAVGAAVAVVLVFCTPRPPTARPTSRLPPGAGPLIAFLVWASLVTVVAPIIFDRMPVLSPGGLPNIIFATHLTSSNIAQSIYLALGIFVFVYVARSSAGPEIVGLAVGLVTVLSFWRYLNQGFGVPFPEDFFDNSPAFAYIETAPSDVQRFRGILSEPAGLAVSSLVTICYAVPRSLRVHGWHRINLVVLAGIAVFLGLVSTSATFVVAGVVIGSIATAVSGLGFLLRRVNVGLLIGCVIMGLLIAMIWLLPQFISFVEATVNAKVSSSSFDDRSNSDSVSYGIFLDTFGLGVGLGTNRASSFLPGLLSTTGLVGGVLFASVVISLMVKSASLIAYRPVLWCLTGLLVVKLVSGPDLSDTSGVLWLTLGLLSKAVMDRGSATGRLNVETTGQDVVRHVGRRPASDSGPSLS